MEFLALEKNTAKKKKLAKNVNKRATMTIKTKLVLAMANIQ